MTRWQAFWSMIKEYPIESAKILVMVICASVLTVGFFGTGEIGMIAAATIALHLAVHDLQDIDKDIQAKHLMNMLEESRDEFGESTVVYTPGIGWHTPEASNKPDRPDLDKTGGYDA